MSSRLFPHSRFGASVRTSVIGGSIALIGGVWLQYVHKDLLLITPLLLALPAINAMGGDLASIVSAHISDPQASVATRKKLWRILLLVVPLNTLGVTALSLFFARLQDYEFTADFAYRYAGFIFATFAAVVLVIVMLSLLLNKILAQKQINSDDVLIPVANIIASIMLLAAISAAVWLIF